MTSIRSFIVAALIWLLSTLSPKRVAHAAVLLTDQLKVERDPLRAGVLNELLIRSDVMQLLPFETLNRLNVRITRWKTLPSVAFRQLNASYAESTGTTEQLEETVYPLGGDIDVDVAFVKDQGSIVDHRALQRQMKARATAYQFNDSFISGDQAANPDSFSGIKKRIASLPSTQSVSGGTNGLDVRASTANMFTFLKLLDQTMYWIDGGMGMVTALLMNDDSFLGITDVLRQRNLLTTLVDAFGRIIYQYGPNGPRLIDMGVKADQTTKIITTTETQGNTSDNTSIYAVRFGQAGDYLHGIEQYPLDIRDLGEQQTKPVYRDRLDWPVGLAHWNDRSIVRLYGVRWTS